MRIPKITSPMATGNGAYIVHKELEKKIPDYSVKGYNPYLTLMPFILKSAVQLKGADILHTTPDYAWFFMRPSMPAILTFHNYVLDSWMQSFSSKLQRLHYKTDLKFFVKKAISKASVITAVSRYTADLARMDLGITNNIQVIYNGVDAKFFTPKNKTNKKKIRVFYSGNISLRKGAQWLPAIASGLDRNIEIHYTSGLNGKKIIKNAPSNLIPVGSIPYTKMPDFYNSMDFLLMPTVREGFSLSVLEAMACGLPVVASDCSSLPEQVIDNKGGFLCPVGDVDAFIEKIHTMAASQPLRAEMGAFNREKVKKDFTIHNMVRKYEELFQKIYRGRAIRQ